MRIHLSFFRSQNLSKMIGLTKKWVKYKPIPAISISSRKCNKLPNTTFCALYIMTLGREGNHCGFEKQNFVSKILDSTRHDVLLRHIISPNMCSPFQGLPCARKNIRKAKNINTISNG